MICDDLEMGHLVGVFHHRDVGVLYPWVRDALPPLASNAILAVTSVSIEFCVLLAYGALAGRITRLATQPRESF
jgi:hypothetical protein